MPNCVFFSGALTAWHCRNRYCPQGSIEPTACPMGTFNPEGSAGFIGNCRPCQAGYACPFEGLLVSTDTPCSRGHWCPAGTRLPTEHPCPPGTHSSSTSLTRSEDCIVCSARQACGWGTGGPDNPPVSCAQGHFCPLGTEFPTQFPCAPGTYSSSTNLASQAGCTVCPAGVYCEGGQSSPSQSCAAGHFCLAATTYATQHPCPAGTFTALTTLTSNISCSTCPRGSFCRAGSVAPTPCAPGSFQNLPGSSTPSCKQCTAGHQCGSASTNQTACFPGYFSAPGSSVCSICMAGYYCNTNATSDTAMLFNGCPVGLYCPEGVAVTPSHALHSCKTGHYCPQATPSPVQCLPVCGFTDSSRNTVPK